VSEQAYIGANVARLRLDRDLTQEGLAGKAGISRVALGKIERGAVIPRAATLGGLAKALKVPIDELVMPTRPLDGVRFRADKQVHAREQILAQVSKWLDAYAGLERDLDDDVEFGFQIKLTQGTEPAKAAQLARTTAGLGPEEPVRDICGLLEEHGVKVLLFETQRDSFFGLSIGPVGGGPAVVVNTWERISVERWIFTAAHELGHLLLHPSEYQRNRTEVPAKTEREADEFASEFLMPDKAFVKEWSETRGHPLLFRVLKVKRIFRVSYKTVLYRLSQAHGYPSEIWRTFQRQHRTHFGKTLRKADEPAAMQRSEFAWNWRRAGEPEGLSPYDFVEDRLGRLVRKAVEKQRISLGRAAEIFGITRNEMRTRAREWVY